MDCVTFTKWLENRDLHDVSEANKALKHTSRCKGCQRLLSLDEQLDHLIHKAMQPEPMPDSLRHKVEMNLDRAMDSSPKKRYVWYGIVPAAIAAMVVFFLSFPFSGGISSMDEFGKYVVEDHNYHNDAVLVVDKPQELRKLEPIRFEYAVVEQEIPQNYKFVGARICPLGGCPAIHMVYLNEGKRVSLFVVRASDVNFSLSAGTKYTMTMGDHVIMFWKDSGHVYAMTT